MSDDKVFMGYVSEISGQQVTLLDQNKNSIKIDRQFFADNPQIAEQFEIRIKKLSAEKKPSELDALNELLTP